MSEKSVRAEPRIDDSNDNCYHMIVEDERNFDAKSARQGCSPIARRVSQPLRTEELFGSRQEIAILHDGEEYRLRITRNNKLILTK